MGSLHCVLQRTETTAKTIVNGIQAASKNPLLAWAHKHTKAEKLLLYNH